MYKSFIFILNKIPMTSDYTFYINKREIIIFRYIAADTYYYIDRENILSFHILSFKSQRNRYIFEIITDV